jgi:hypothetical protein
MEVKWGMNILVTGSLPEKRAENGTKISVLTEEEVRAFKKTCSEIGAVIAEKGYNLVAGSYRETSADRYVVAGMNEVDGSHKVIVERPQHIPDDFVDFPQDLKRIDLVRFRTGSSWAVGRVRQILKSDAVILIGGNRGTEQVGYMASALGLPVLPIGAFEGTAAYFVRTFESDFRRIGLGDTIREFDTRGKAPDANAVIAVLEKLRRHNPFWTKGHGFGYYALALLAILFVGFLGMALRAVYRRCAGGGDPIFLTGN